MLIEGSAGERFGTVIRTRRAGAFLLRKSRYDSALRLPVHHHPHPYFCFVIRGGLREWRARVDQSFAAGSLHFHPAREPHAGHVGPQGAMCMSIIPGGSIEERILAMPRPSAPGEPLD